MGFYLNVENEKIINCSNEDITSETVKSFEVVEEVYYNYMKNEDRYICVDGTIIEDSGFIERLKEKNKTQFNKEFFKTTLGYIRRTVSMANGETKDFLSDLLPAITTGLNAGLPVKVIAYNEPDFTKDVEDWKEYQHNEVVNAQFIQECIAQLSADFGIVEAV